MADNRPIGFFDSGVGGLSILLEVKRTLPKENFIYIADQANRPYGAKSKASLVKLTKKITEFLIANEIKALVVACNTATCYAILELRNLYNIPIIGTVPAVKPAVQISRKSKVAIFSTPATAKSLYLKNLIKEFAPNTEVLNVACKNLEAAVENQNKQMSEQLLKKYLSVVLDFDADVLVLGCTHYPFLTQKIKTLLPNVRIVDSSRAIANRLQDILSTNGTLSTRKEKELYFTSKNPNAFSKTASILMGDRIIAQKVAI